MFLSLAIWTVNPAFNAGSSKQGNALLASVDSNWVAATTLYKEDFKIDWKMKLIFLIWSIGKIRKISLDRSNN